MTYRGRQPEGLGLGVGGYCICPQRHYSAPHTTNRPCNQMKCPKCGATLIRVGSL